MEIERSLPKFMDKMLYEDEGGSILTGRQLKTIEDSPQGATASQRANSRTTVGRRHSSSDCFPASSCFPSFTFPFSDDNMEDDSLQGGMVKS